MKRLFIFLLSLILVSLAPAAVLELSLNGATNGQHVDQATTLALSGTIMIDVTAGDGQKMDWNLGFLGPGSITGMGTLHIPPSPAGEMSDLSTYYTSYSRYLWYRVAADTNPATAGVWWDAEFHCDGQGLVNIVLFDAALNEIDRIVVTQGEIPEPMTVALLGLGGLLLRRRIKK